MLPVLQKEIDQIFRDEQFVVRVVHTRTVELIYTHINGGYSVAKHLTDYAIVPDLCDYAIVLQKNGAPAIPYNEVSKVQVELNEPAIDHA